MQTFNNNRKKRNKAILKNKTSVNKVNIYLETTQSANKCYQMIEQGKIR